MSSTSSAAASLADAARFRRVADIIAARPRVAAHRRRVGDGRRHRHARARGASSRARAIPMRIATRVEQSCGRDIIATHRRAASARDGGASSRDTSIDGPRGHSATCCTPRRCLHGHSRDTLDLVSGYGEMWSAQMLAAHLASAWPSSGLARRARRAHGRRARDATPRSTVGVVASARSTRGVA